MEVLRATHCDTHVCRWVDPARRWHAFPATFDLLFLREGFGDGSPAAVAAVLRAAAAANATLMLIDSFSGPSGDGEWAGSKRSRGLGLGLKLGSRIKFQQVQSLRLGGSLEFQV